MSVALRIIWEGVWKGIRLQTKIYVTTENMIVQERVTLCLSTGRASGNDDLLLLGADFGESEANNKSGSCTSALCPLV